MMSKGNNGPRLYCEPPESIKTYYEQRGDGCWYATVPMADVPICDLAEINQYVRSAASEAVEGMVLGGVGDVDSDEKGSGARFNSGKPPLNFIPIEQQMVIWVTYKMPDSSFMLEIMDVLGRFEKGQAEMWQVMRLLTVDDLNGAAYVWEYGSKKYAPFNWAKGMAWSIPFACIGRHMGLIMQGEEIDEESGYSHWGHVVCNILMLDHYSRYFTEGDDRPPKEVFE